MRNLCSGVERDSRRSPGFHAQDTLACACFAVRFGDPDAKAGDGQNINSPKYQNE